MLHPTSHCVDNYSPTSDSVIPTQCHVACECWAVRWIKEDSSHSVNRAAHATCLQGALLSHPKLRKTVQQRQNCLVYLGFSLVCG